MARQPKQMMATAQLTASAATKYTAPALTPGAIVRHIHLYNADTSARTVTISIGTDAAGTRIYDAVSIPASTEMDRFCYYVLTSGQIIQAFADVTAKVTCTIDGEEIIAA